MKAHKLTGKSQPTSIVKPYKSRNAHQRPPSHSLNYQSTNQEIVRRGELIRTRETRKTQARTRHEEKRDNGCNTPAPNSRAKARLFHNTIYDHNKLRAATEYRRSQPAVLNQPYYIEPYRRKSKNQRSYPKSRDNC